MPNDPEQSAPDEEDHYLPADLGDDTPEPDEDTRLRLIAEGEARESRREILLGQIAVVRHALYAAEDAGDTARVAALREKLAGLTRERAGL
jgi:hypothetical protein